MKKNILITGGAGFIGIKTALEFVKDGYNITIMDNLSAQIHGENPSLPKTLLENCNFIKGDVRIRKDWIKSLKNIDVICHFAAETGTGQSMYKIQQYTEVNINGTSIMLDILTSEKHSVEKVILASSRAIYGEGKYYCRTHGVVYPKTRNKDNMNNRLYDPQCSYCNKELKLLATDENSLINPTSIYGITKQAQEQLIVTTCSALDIPYVSLRFQNVYGPGQSLKNPYTGILSIFSTLILNNKDINVFEDGKESRDFIYIDDVVASIKLSLENENANYNIFNVGSGKSVDVEMIANSLIRLYSKNINVIISGDYRVGDIRHNYADLTKIKSRLNFSPNITFEVGLKYFVHWVKKQNVQSNKFDSSISEMSKLGLYKKSK